MRTPEEIERMADTLGNVPQSLKWKGDNFRYGYHVGRLEALEWVLGQMTAGELSIHRTYEDWQREQEIAGEDVRSLRDEQEDQAE